MALYIISIIYFKKIHETLAEHLSDLRLKPRLSTRKQALVTNSMLGIANIKPEAANGDTELGSVP